MHVLCQQPSLKRPYTNFSPPLFSYTIYAFYSSFCERNFLYLFWVINNLHSLLSHVKTGYQIIFLQWPYDDFFSRISFIKIIYNCYANMNPIFMLILWCLNHETSQASINSTYFIGWNRRKELQASASAMTACKIARQATSACINLISDIEHPVCRPCKGSGLMKLIKKIWHDSTESNPEGLTSQLSNPTYWSLSEHVSDCWKTKWHRHSRECSFFPFF